MNAITSKTLWDSLGNTCRVELYKIGANEFELYLHDFNQATARRFVGGIGELNNRADLWLAMKKEAGFQEQLPSYNPHVWTA